MIQIIFINDTYKQLMRSFTLKDEYGVEENSSLVERHYIYYPMIEEILKKKEISELNEIEKLCYLFNYNKNNDILIEEGELVYYMSKKYEQMRKNKKMWTLARYKEDQIRYAITEERYRERKEEENRLKEEENRRKEEENRLKEEENRLKEEENRLKEEENRLKEEENRLKEEENKRKEEENKQKEEENKQKEEENKQKEEENKQKEEENKKKEEMLKVQEESLENTVSKVVIECLKLRFGQEDYLWVKQLTIPQQQILLQQIHQVETLEELKNKVHI